MMRRFHGQKKGGSDSMTVVKLDKSGGCVDRDEGYRKRFCRTQVREYFFGNAKNTLSPHTQQIDFAQLSIYKLAECELCHSNPFDPLV